MPLEPHHKVREESTGGTATQLTGKKRRPLPVAQNAGEAKPGVSHQAWRDRATDRVYAAPGDRTTQRGDHAYGLWQFGRYSWDCADFSAGSGEWILCRRRVFHGRGATEPRGPACR